MYHRCQKCGKQLTDPESMLRGFGPDCWSEIVRAVTQSLDNNSEQIPGQLSLWDIMDDKEEIYDNTGTADAE